MFPITGGDSATHRPDGDKARRSMQILRFGQAKPIARVRCGGVLFIERKSALISPPISDISFDGLTAMHDLTNIARCAVPLAVMRGTRQLIERNRNKIDVERWAAFEHYRALLGAGGGTRQISTANRTSRLPTTCSLRANGCCLCRDQRSLWRGLR